MKKDLKIFGIMLGIIFLGISVYLYKSTNSAIFSFIGLFLIFISFTNLRNLLKPFYCIWMFFAKKIGFAMSIVILTTVYILLITPIGMLARIKKPFLNIKKDYNISYWEKINEKTNFYKQY